VHGGVAGHRTGGDVQGAAVVAGLDLGAERAQRADHQVAVPGGEGAADRGGLAGQCGQRQGPVGQRLRPRDGDRGIERAVRGGRGPGGLDGLDRLDRLREVRHPVSLSVAAPPRSASSAATSAGRTATVGNAGTGQAESVRSTNARAAGLGLKSLQARSCTRVGPSLRATVRTSALVGRTAGVSRVTASAWWTRPSISSMLLDSNATSRSVPAAWKARSDWTRP